MHVRMHKAYSKCNCTAHTHAPILVRHSLTNQPPRSRTHAHLVGVSRIGTSLQHCAKAGRESEACAMKHERVFIVVRDNGVLRKRRLHLVGTRVLAGVVKGRFAILIVEQASKRDGCMYLCSILSRTHMLMNMSS